MIIFRWVSSRAGSFTVKIRSAAPTFARRRWIWSAFAVALALISALSAGATDAVASPSGSAPGARPATHGTVYRGFAFDTCSLPSIGAIKAWSHSRYRAVAIYIGGPDEGCPQPLSAAWVGAVTALGWKLIPVYVSLQAPLNRCGCASMSPSQARSQGWNSAHAAASRASAIGIGKGSPIYDDMEAYTRGPSNSPAVMAFLQGWTQELHARGYKSGVYSTSTTGIADLVQREGTKYTEPDDIWFAAWNGSPTVSDAYIPSRYWSKNQRMHQFTGPTTLRYGGIALNIDSDYCDGLLAAG